MANYMDVPRSDTMFAARKKASDEQVDLHLKQMFEIKQNSSVGTPVGLPSNHSEWPLPSTLARPGGKENTKPKAWGKGRTMTPSVVPESPATKIQDVTDVEACEQMDTAAISNLQAKFKYCSTAGTVEEESRGIRVTPIEVEEQSIRVKPWNNLEKEKRERQQHAANLQFNLDFNTVRWSLKQGPVEHTCTPKSQAWCSLRSEPRGGQSHESSGTFFYLDTITRA